MVEDAERDAVMAELAGMDDARARAINAAHGDDHGVNLSRLRALAKRLKTNQPLAIALWASGDTAARLLATLIGRPKAFSPDDLDRMVHQIAAPKLLDWFVTHLVKPGPHGEVLRPGWMEGDGLVGRAGWSLTTERVIKSPEGLDLDALLDRIEAGMKQAPAPKQWAMNHCLAEIGIRDPDRRARAVAIGEKLEVLIDYPVPPGCTSPYAPLWIAELVRRREG